MGNKVSVIRGVKSNDYYKPGNAINEIWLGHLELISRLPFGDSDLGQSAWPTGGWPKIPWHNFIIPLKRRGLDEPDDGYRNHHHLPVSADTVSFETASLIAAWVLLFLVILAYSVPIVLRRYSIPYDMIHGKDKVEQRKGGYALRAYVATTAFSIGLVLSVLDLQALVVTRRVSDANGSNLMLLLQVLAALVSMVGMWYSIKAVYALWADWKKISRQKIDDDIGAPSAVLEEKLPPILLSWMERQRRP